MLTYPGWNIRSYLLTCIPVKRSSARVVGGGRFETVVEAHATVATTVEPCVRMRTASVLPIGLQWFVDQSPAGTIGPTSLICFRGV
jgi:hypothetical protein